MNETVPAEPMPAELRALLTVDTRWTARHAAIEHLHERSWSLRHESYPAAADMAERAADAELRDPAPAREDWTR